MLIKRSFAIIIIWLIWLNICASQEIQFSKIDTASSAMVVAAHSGAVDVGIDILKKGGNAVDAAAAMAFVIGAVEPHASGLGGGGGMLIYLKKENTFKYLDYYVQSPLNPDYDYSRKEGVATVRSICIPGTPSGLITSVKKYGNFSLEQVMYPAIETVKNGVIINDDLAEAILDKLETIMTFPETQNIFFNKYGLPLTAGDTLFNESLLNVMMNLKNLGSEYFYNGDFSQVASNSIAELGGTITTSDFSNYNTLIKKPVIQTFRDYTIISAPPPQSGITLLEILNIIENFPQTNWKLFEKSPTAIHMLIEAILRADVDRFNYLGDPKFFNVPVIGLLDKNYARSRFSDININKVKYQNHYDIPKGNPIKFQNDQKKINSEKHSESPHTTHISVIDTEGNIVSLTQTLGLFFGSGFSSNGVLFNSAMTNFYNNEDSPNKLEPGKRPTSTICPTIIMNEGKVVAILGTPGGINIFNTMAEVIIRLLDFGQSPVEAVDAPRFSPRVSREKVNFEGRFSQDLASELEKMGHNIRRTEDYNQYLGGVQLIYFDKKLQKYIGVSDPRRAGAAKGLNQKAEVKNDY